MTVELTVDVSMTGSFVEGQDTNGWRANSELRHILYPGTRSASVKPSKSSESEEKDISSPICSNPEGKRPPPLLSSPELETHSVEGDCSELLRRDPIPEGGEVT